VSPVLADLIRLLADAAVEDYLFQHGGKSGGANAATVDQLEERPMQTWSLGLKEDIESYARQVPNGAKCTATLRNQGPSGDLR
jgi:hypothetical protein